MTSKSRRNGCILLVFFLLMATVAVGLSFLVMSIAVPENSPLAQMYRTEAALALLINAIETYRADLGDFPPPGQEGLRLATRHLSRHVNYVTDEQSLDAWGRPFVYVPARAYTESDSPAIRDGIAFFAPDTYQLYSVGIDGDAGLESAAKRADNIVSWDDRRTWRERYRKLHQEFFIQRGTVQ